jgi:hypothetical protein
MNTEKVDHHHHMPKTFRVHQSHLVHAKNPLGIILQLLTTLEKLSLLGEAHHQSRGMLQSLMRAIHQMVHHLQSINNINHQLIHHSQIESQILIMILTMHHLTLAQHPFLHQRKQATSIIGLLHQELDKALRIDQDQLVYMLQTIIGQHHLCHHLAKDLHLIPLNPTEMSLQGLQFQSDTENGRMNPTLPSRNTLKKSAHA